MKKPASTELKRPANAATTQDEYVTPRTECICGKALSKKGKAVDAVVYGLAGKTQCKHYRKQCNCGRSYGYNYRWRRGKKVNTVDLSDVSVLFVTANTAFEIQFLKYHDSLQFLGFLSGGAIAACSIEVLFKNGVHDTHWFMVQYYDARMLMLAMQELHPLGETVLHNIVISDEFSPSALTAYDKHMHQKAFPPKCKQNVKEMSGDGHEKVMVKISKGCAAPMKRTGRPRKNKAKKQQAYGNGWFMLTDPKDGRVLAIEQQFEPENNAVKKKCLKKVLPLYNQCDCFIHDRACSTQPQLEKDVALKQIKYYTCDKFHSFRHKKTCKCNPHYVLRLKRRVAKVNTSVSEQVFSWFRGYSRVLNEMKACRHHFLVLYYCAQHNKHIEAGTAKYLNAYSHLNKSKQKQSRSYSCTMKVKKYTMKKVMRRAHC